MESFGGQRPRPLSTVPGPARGTDGRPCRPSFHEHPLLVLDFLKCPGDVDGFTRPRIAPRVVHRRREGHRRRGEDLDAFNRAVPFFFQPPDFPGQLPGLAGAAAGMGDHEIIFQMPAAGNVGLPKGPPEFLKGPAGILVHQAEDVFRNVLRGDLEKARDVMPDKLADVFLAGQG